MGRSMPKFAPFVVARLDSRDLLRGSWGSTTTLIGVPKMRNRDWIDGDYWHSDGECPGGLSTFDPNGPQRNA